MSGMPFCCVLGCGEFPLEGTNICQYHYQQYLNQVSGEAKSPSPGSEKESV